jgi:hypothetical protein
MRVWLAPLCSMLALLVPAASAGTATATSGEACPPPVSTPVPGGLSGTSAPLPAALPAPPQEILACVGSMAINGATVDHWAAVARKGDTAEHSSAHSKSRPLPVRETIKEVMAFLISSDWVIGEAARLGISASEVTVRRQFDRIRREQFPHGREFARFLRESGQTIADLLFRVRLNILSSAIQKQVAGRALPNENGRTLSEFIKAFKARWKAQTVCVPAFSVADCGSSQEPL